MLCIKRPAFRNGKLLLHVLMPNLQMGILSLESRCITEGFRISARGWLAANNFTRSAHTPHAAVRNAVSVCIFIDTLAVGYALDSPKILTGEQPQYLVFPYPHVSFVTSESILIQLADRLNQTRLCHVY